MRKKVKGVLKPCKLPETGETGYRDLWNTGKASILKKRKKLTGLNRPGT